eukprot:1676013-Pleurochrysis_carterae.AAC.2
MRCCRAGQMRFHPKSSSCGNHACRATDLAWVDEAPRVGSDGSAHVGSVDERLCESVRSGGTKDGQVHQGGASASVDAACRPRNAYLVVRRRGGDA